MIKEEKKNLRVENDGKGGQLEDGVDVNMKDIETK